MTTVRLTHFIQGQIDVVAIEVEGRHEWADPTRPMRRTLPHCYFTEAPDYIDRLWVTHARSTVEGVGHNADRLSAVA